MLTRSGFHAHGSELIHWLDTLKSVAEGHTAEGWRLAVYEIYILTVTLSFFLSLLLCFLSQWHAHIHSQTQHTHTVYSPTPHLTDNQLLPTLKVSDKNSMMWVQSDSWSFTAKATNKKSQKIPVYPELQTFLFSLCVCVCVCETERERESVCVCVFDLWYCLKLACLHIWTALRNLLCFSVIMLFVIKNSEAGNNFSQYQWHGEK